MLFSDFLDNFWLIRHVLLYPTSSLDNFMWYKFISACLYYIRKVVPHVIYICCLLGKFCRCEFSHVVVFPFFIIVHIINCVIALTCVVSITDILRQNFLLWTKQINCSVRLRFLPKQMISIVMSSLLSGSEVNIIFVTSVTLPFLLRIFYFNVHFVKV